LAPRDIASRAAKEVCDEGRGIGPSGRGVYLDFTDAIQRLGRKTIEERYGNLFEMYHDITAEDPYEVPMRIYPAPHYAMGGLWVDYNLMSNVPGLYVLGNGDEPNQALEKAGRVADFFELAELMCIDALHRNESCGGHFRVEYQADGEAKRNDDEYLYVGAWEYAGADEAPVLHKESLR